MINLLKIIFKHFSCGGGGIYSHTSLQISFTLRKCLVTNTCTYFERPTMNLSLDASNKGNSAPDIEGCSLNSGWNPTKRRSKGALSTSLDWPGHYSPVCQQHRTRRRTDLLSARGTLRPLSWRGWSRLNVSQYFWWPNHTHN